MADYGENRQSRSIGLTTIRDTIHVTENAASPSAGRLFRFGERDWRLKKVLSKRRAPDVLKQQSSIRPKTRASEAIVTRLRPHACAFDGCAWPSCFSEYPATCRYPAELHLISKPGENTINSPRFAGRVLSLLVKDPLASCNN